ncbi:MAG: lipoate--protein ligase family protein [Geobacteraceae bacterium]|nr:lipoate--protein ligase family protein [Geobacteraceae bacterium]
MATDESLLYAFNPIASDPVLRFYGWNPPALTLGRFQIPEEVLDLEVCHADSLAVIRRISGGGVIYHADELTYSIVCSPSQIPAATSVKDSFRILTGFLIDFYRSIGLDASFATDYVSDSKQLGTRTAFCFAGNESYDILINGKKIGGNAQRRHKNVIFQHGSIPLVNHANTGLAYMSDRSPQYALSTTSLVDCGVTMDKQLLKAMLVAAFKRCMAADLHESLLSHNEQQVSQQLFAGKYSTECWNLRGEVA